MNKVPAFLEVDRSYSHGDAQLIAHGWRVLTPPVSISVVYRMGFVRLMHTPFIDTWQASAGDGLWSRVAETPLQALEACGCPTPAQEDMATAKRSLLNRLKVEVE